MKLLVMVTLALLLIACGGGGEKAPVTDRSTATVSVDAIVIRAVGIDARLQLKKLGTGALPSPDKAEDVALYDFGVAGLGGSPGSGNVVLAARSLSEIACKDGAEPAPCKGAFFSLASVPPGERIELAWQGKNHRYQVVSICNVATREFGDGLYRRTTGEQLTLLTGIGELGPSGFSHTLVVIAKPAPVTASEPCPAGTKTGPAP